MTMMEEIRQDAAYAVTMLRRAPGFSMTAVLTLALGIGMATAVFSVVNGVLLRPLPYAGAERMVNIWNDYGEPGVGQSLPAITASGVAEYRRRSTLFEEFSYATGTRDVFSAGIVTSEGAAPERLQINSASANFLSMLNADPILGSGFTEDDEAIGGPAVVLISHALWQRRFGGDENVIGRTLEIDGEPHRIQGVLPAGFRLMLPEETYSLADGDVWAPMRINWEDPIPWTIFTVFGRMKEGVTLEQAQSELSAMALAMRAEDPVLETNKLRIRAIPLQQDVTKAIRPTLLLLLCAATLLVVTASANVANLLLARATAREREISIRVAIGASRWRLARQLITEGLVLSFAGGVLGLLFAFAGLELLSRTPVELPRLHEVRIDWAVLGFLGGLCAIVALAFGLVPALHGLRGVRNALTGAARSTGHGTQPRLRTALVMAEIALSLVLLVAAGLLVRSLTALQNVEPGFESAGAITFSVALPRPEYLFEHRVLYTQALIERLAALPGVTAAGASSLLPFTGQPPTSSYRYIGDDAPGGDRSIADRAVITKGYLRAAGTRLLEGREFEPSDHMNAPPVVIVDEEIARRGWPNESAVGKQIEVSGFQDPPTIIGVVEHMRIHDLAAEGVPQIYFSQYARPSSTLNYFVRTSQPPEQLAPSIASIVTALDSDVPPSNVVPLDGLLAQHLAGARLNLILMQTIGVIALLLSAIGLYGVIAFVVGQRRREFAVRLALGETARGLSLLVLRSGALVIVASIALGIAAAFVAGRLMSAVLFGVSPHDPATFAIVSAFLAAVALGACYVPALRASRVAPGAALRAE